MKLFQGNQYRRHLVIKIARITKRVIMASLLLDVIGWALYAGTNLKTTVVYADHETVKTVTIVASTTAPVMDRIAKCESNGSQTDKTGQVVLHVNNDNTVDVGEYQINSVHFKQATQMGYDLTKEADNKAYAMWLYANKGTSDWYSSQSCWDK